VQDVSKLQVFFNIQVAIKIVLESSRQFSSSN